MHTHTPATVSKVVLKRWRSHEHATHTESEASLALHLITAATLTPEAFTKHRRHQQLAITIKRTLQLLPTQTLHSMR